MVISKTVYLTCIASFVAGVGLNHIVERRPVEYRSPFIHLSKGTWVGICQDEATFTVHGNEAMIDNKISFLNVDCTLPVAKTTERIP